MPGPMHKSPRHPGPRPDPEGNERKPNRKAAARLARRSYPQGLSGYHAPGSQNRKKS